MDEILDWHAYSLFMDGWNVAIREKFRIWYFLICLMAMKDYKLEQCEKEKLSYKLV